jgi:hypothetical protein
MSLNVFVILGQRHGSDEIEQIGEPIHANDAREAFMPYRAKQSDPNYQRVWLCRAEVERDVRLSAAQKQPAPVAHAAPSEPAADSIPIEQPSASKKKK